MSSLVDRLQAFSLAVIQLFELLPRRRVAYVLGDQFLRAGLSPGGHFREALRARSKAEYVAKLNGGVMELEEAIHWLDVIVGAKILEANEVESIRSEANQLIAIFLSLINKWKPASKIFAPTINVDVRTRQDELPPSAFRLAP